MDIGSGRSIEAIKFLGTGSAKRLCGNAFARESVESPKQQHVEFSLAGVLPHAEEPGVDRDCPAFLIVSQCD